MTIQGNWYKRLSLKGYILTIQKRNIDSVLNLPCSKYSKRKEELKVKVQIGIDYSLSMV